MSTKQHDDLIGTLKLCCFCLSLSICVGSWSIGREISNKVQPGQRHVWAYIRYKDSEATQNERKYFEPEEFIFRYDHDKAFRESIKSYEFRP